MWAMAILSLLAERVFSPLDEERLILIGTVSTFVLLAVYSSLGCGLVLLSGVTSQKANPKGCV